MWHSPAVAIVEFCARRRWPVIFLAAAVAAAAALYALGHFAIDTNAERLLGSNVPSVKRQLAYHREFPPHQIIAVVDAPTPELAEIAARKLTAELRRRPDLFRLAQDPQDSVFAERSALLHLPPPQLAAVLAGIKQSAPALTLLTADPSLRGVMRALAMGAEEASNGTFQAGALDRPMTRLSELIEAVFAHRFAGISWRGPMNGNLPGLAAAAPARRFIEIDPKLHYNALQPGRAATDAIRAAARDLHLRRDYGARLALTGQVPLDDAQFATLSRSAIPELVGTAAAVLAILFLALRSLRIILAAFLTLAVGFAITAAVGLLEVGAFNLISVAFAVLFVGIGADFAIQFSVRHRAERYEAGDLRAALHRTAQKAGNPLALAAAGTAVGFLCFMPTDYRGVAELGEIAGSGMLIAFAATMTLLPALLSALGTPPERRPMGFHFLAPVDHFLARRRYVVVIPTILAVLAGLPLLGHIRFDFDPTHLQDPNSPSVKTYRALRADPLLGLDAADAVAPSVDRLPSLVQPLRRLPEVAATRSVLDLIPPDQGPKIVQIRALAATLLPDLTPKAPRPPPSDAERIAATRTAAAALQRLAQTAKGATETAVKRLLPLLDRLAAAPLGVRDAAAFALTLPLNDDLERLRNMLQPQPVSLQSQSPAAKRDWVAPDGGSRVEILPKGNPDDPQVLRRFARAVLSVAPGAAGSPIELYAARQTVIAAFIEAGALALVVIAVILWIALRRLSDVLLTLVPLVVAGLVTLELMALFGLALNFANIIALPLLLGIGVAFKIYYILAWRRGRTNLLQSTLTRAVFFSALTTATAFGSLWLSSNPGMASMGRLMALALACTLAAAVLFQPALMGPPRVQPAAGPSQEPAAPAPQPARERERVD